MLTAYYQGQPVWTYEGPTVPDLQLEAGWYYIGWIKRRQPKEA